MADLNDIQSVQSVKIVGQNSTGVEETPVGSDIRGNLKVINESINLTDSAAGTRSTLVAGIDESNIQRALLTDAEGRLVTSALTGFGADFSFGDVTTAAISRTPVTRTVYTEQITNAQRSIVSSNAADSAVGVGARTVRITYLDQTGAGPFTETVTLNGTTAVNTIATNICFIEQIEVRTAGTNGLNSGIISLRAAVAGGGVTIGSIGTGEIQTYWTHHYVPVGKTCNITGLSCGHNGTTVGSGALFTLNSNPLNSPNSVETQISDFVRLYGQSSTFSRNYSSPIKVFGPAKIRAFVTPETATSINYRCSFDFFEP